MVVDADRKVRGIVLDGDLLGRCGPERKPGLLQALFPFGRKETACPMGVAAEVMQPNVHTVAEDAPLTAVLQRMLATGAKRLVVVDDEERLLGLVDRESLLRVIAGG